MKYMLLQILLLVIVSDRVSSSCQKICGEVSIPFPFGIGKGCFLEDDYEVRCIKSVPFLPKIQKEIVSIRPPTTLEDENDLLPPFGSLRVKTQVTSLGCNSTGIAENSETTVLNFEGTPFSIAAHHTIVSYGCNSKATVTNIEPRLVGCISTCGEKYFEEVPCNGEHCCYAEIPGKLWDVVGVKIESREGGDTTTQSCRVAFLTDQYNKSTPWYKRTDPIWFYRRQNFTINLEWKVGTTNISIMDSLGCSSNHEDFLSKPCHCHYETTSVTGGETFLILRCACIPGYTGNPYDQQDGCQDINECASADKCNKGGTCLNIPGSFECVIVKDNDHPIYIGVGIGSTILLIGVGYWGYSYARKIRDSKIKRGFFVRNGGILMEQIASGDSLAKKPVLFGSDELEKATAGFSEERVLGQGGQATVFKGMMKDGSIVAVKKAKAVTDANLEVFINELVLLSQVIHRNIVRILGYCLETEVPTLVYEFIANGNLYEKLHPASEDQETLSWSTRLRISLDISGALWYLHSAAASPIFHKDIKSSNIMLDETFNAKLSDFGTSKLIATGKTHVTTLVSGTPGYIDPEFYRSSHYSEKSEVYSLGVVFLELITGQKAICFDRSEENPSLSTYFLGEMKEGRVVDLIDPRIRYECDLDQVLSMAKLAKACLKLKKDKRPTMTEVFNELQRIASSSSGASNVASTSKSHEHDDYDG